MHVEGTVLAGRGFDPIEGRVVVEEDRRAKLLVLDGDPDNLAGARDPVRTVVRRAGPGDVKRIVL
jgi:cytosine/adenosine deaminase-related metal-dependent hydrolase